MGVKATFSLRLRNSVTFLVTIYCLLYVWQIQFHLIVRSPRVQLFRLLKTSHHDYVSWKTAVKMFSARCEDGWAYFRFTNFCYRYNGTSGIDFYDAERSCPAFTWIIEKLDFLSGC